MSELKIDEIAAELLELEQVKARGELSAELTVRRHQLMGQLMDALRSYPVRDERRVFERIPAIGEVEIRADGVRQQGQLIDLSMSGLAVVTKHEYMPEQKVRISMIRMDSSEFPLSLISSVAWTNRDQIGRQRVGLTFESQDTASVARVVRFAYKRHLHMLTKDSDHRTSVTWEISSEGDRTILALTGELDESTNLGSLRSLSGAITFDLAGIRRINSEGVRAWIDFLRGLDDATHIRFVRCSVPVVNQLNMIAEFSQKAEISSFYAPYICMETGLEETKLLTRKEVSDPYSPPSFPCAGGVMELDDVPERYFFFLVDED